MDVIILAAMDLFTIIFLLIAGAATGFVNTISAAGSLISLTSLMFTGLTAAEANATNRVGILFQNLSSAYGFKSKGLKTEPYMWWLAAATVPGAVIGAWFSLKVPDYLFNRILIGVMVFFLIITITNPLKNLAGNKELMSDKRKLWGVILYFFIGMYGGFIQAGSGFLLMAGCMLLHRFDIIKTNHYKAVIMFTYTIAAFLMFLWKGNINWYYGLVMSVGTSAGGFFASRWSIDASENLIRWIIIVLIAVMIVYLGWFK